MSKRLNLTLLPLVLLISHAAASAAALPRTAPFRLRPHSAPLPAASNEREQDGLAGPVRRVKTETAKIVVKNGKPVEGPRQVLETTTYDQRGARVDNAYFLAAGGQLTGKEVYKYDDRGNMVEMTLHNDDGSLLAKEVYAYEFDAVGNWVKMTTSVAMMEGGKITFEPSEVTYRTISYFLDETMLAKMSQPAAAQPAASQPPPNAAAPSSVKVANAQPTPAQPRPTPAQPAAAAAQQPSKGAPARNTAAPLMVTASLEKGASLAPSVPTVASNAAPAAGGPAVKSDSEAPVVPLRSGPLRPISGGILNGKALSLPAPTYPDTAKRARVAGVVEVEVVIDLSGKVISAKAVRGPAMLQAAAEAAARLARFTPTLLSGQPMKVAGVITYNFTLQ